MDQKLNLLGIEVNNYSAAEAIERAKPYFENDVMNVINIIYSDMLVAAKEDLRLKEEIETADITIIGDKAILSAAGISDEVRAREIEKNVFLVSLIGYLSDRYKRIHFLAEKEEDNIKIADYLAEYCHELNIAGMSAMENISEDEDKIVNEINGSDPDIVISALPSPMQGEFINTHRTKLGVKVWFGIGAPDYVMNGKASLLKRLIEQGILKRQVSKFKTQEENSNQE